MPILICYCAGDQDYMPGDMINAKTVHFGDYTYWSSGSIDNKLSTHWRLAKDLEIDIWYNSMASIPETLKLI